MIAINPIPAFNDNYLWLMDNGKDAVIVDPGDAGPVERYLQDNNLNLAAILLTHHHADHIGGVARLSGQFQCQIIGPANDPVGKLDIECREGDQVKIPGLALQFNVIEVPGHTKGHIAYYSEATAEHGNLLFCGDTVFSGGCGRLFEGTPAQMWQSMQKLMELPDDTLIFPAHEYTQANLEFARVVEPNNLQLQHYQQLVDQYRSNQQPSLPTSLGIEKQVNPFMRIRQPSVIAAAEKRLQQEKPSEDAVFGAIRQWKDSF